MKKFSSIDLLYIAIFSAIGLAIKPIVTPLIHIVSAPLMIPGGSLAGGLYLMWIPITIAIVKKPGTGFIFGLCQGIVILSLGYFGSHGAVSILSYTIPGIIADLVALFFRKKESLTCQTMICCSSNIFGAIIVTVLVMRLAFIPLLISIIAAAISGIIGGILAYQILNKLNSLKIIKLI